METILKADIFFVISSIGVIAATIALIVVSYYIVKALEEVCALAKRAREELDSTVERMRRVEHDMHARVRMFSRFLNVLISADFFRNIFRNRNEPRNPLNYEKSDPEGP